MQEKLDDIIAQHKVWINDYKQGTRADLQNYDIRGLDLKGADLRWANLWKTDFQDVGFTNININDAYFYGIFFRPNKYHVDFTKIKNYETTTVCVFRAGWRPFLIKELVICQKMIENKDKNLAILYKNTWMADECKKILKNS